MLGATLLVQYWTGITPAITGFVLDLSGYLLGLKYLGWGFLLRSLVASGAFSVFYRMWEHIGWLLPDMTDKWQTTDFTLPRPATTADMKQANMLLQKRLFLHTMVLRTAKLIH